MAEDFKSLISAELDLSKVEQQIRELNKKYNLNLKVDSNGKGAQSLSKLTRNIALAEKQSGSFGATLKNALGIGSAAAVTIRSILTINRLAKDMVENANRINDSMTQLKIVTKENDDVYKQYGQDVAQTAMEIGASMNNASSSLAAGGNTFEQSVALLTSANTAI